MPIADFLTADYFNQDPELASWRDALGGEFALPYFTALRNRLVEEDVGQTIYPQPENIFQALRLTSLPDVKVVIVGQDPYYQAGRAHGLAFSVANGESSDSLAKIIAEVKRDIGDRPGTNGDPLTSLTSWAAEGVLLLNSVLTVREGCAKSHYRWGWERFTSRIIQTVNKKCDPVVFMLWGKKAQEKVPAIDWQRHKLLCARHPTQGLSDCKHFSQANLYLEEHDAAAVRWWSIDN